MRSLHSESPTIRWNSENKRKTYLFLIFLCTLDYCLVMGGSVVLLWTEMIRDSLEINVRLSEQAGNILVFFAESPLVTIPVTSVYLRTKGSQFHTEVVHLLNANDAWTPVQKGKRSVRLSDIAVTLSWIKYRSRWLGWKDMFTKRNTWCK